MNESAMRVLVTGAAGFLGRRLVRSLAASGHEVIAMVRSPPAGEARDFLSGPRVTLLRFDFERPNWDVLPHAVDAFYSLAQSSNFRSFPDKASEIFQVNVSGLLGLLEWARGAGVKRAVLASSGGIYGAQQKRVFEESDLLAFDSPLGFYLGTKLCAEVLFQNYRHFFDSAVILRPFFMYGPGQRADMLIPRLIDAVRSGRSVQLHGASGLRLNPVYIDDAVAAFAAALRLTGYHVINVAGPTVLSLKEIAEAIGSRVGKPPRFEFIEGEASNYVASTETARIKLGMPQTPFVGGLAHTLASPVSARDDPRAAE